MKRAFTFIELLIVISILALLSSLIFPSIAKAKSSAQRTSCASNLRQLGTGLSLYQSDYDDTYPAAIESNMKGLFITSDHYDYVYSLPEIRPVITSYLGRSVELFKCPSDIGIDHLDFFSVPVVDSPSSYIKAGSSYLYNYTLAVGKAPNLGSPLTSTEIRNPSSSALLYDRSGAWHTSSRLLPNHDVWHNPSLYSGYRYNVIHCDLHLKYLSAGKTDFALGQAEDHKSQFNPPANLP